LQKTNKTTAFLAKIGCFVELLSGFEPETSSLPMVAMRYFFVFSLKKGSYNLLLKLIFFQYRSCFAETVCGFSRQIVVTIF